MPEKGKISIHAENIMPVIKKWLYSDKDIFVRELVSNGCDAISKFKRLVAVGEAEDGAPYRVDVVADPEKKSQTTKSSLCRAAISFIISSTGLG